MTKQFRRLILQWKSTSTIVNKNPHFRQGRSKHKKKNFTYSLMKNSYYIEFHHNRSKKEGSGP